MSVATKQLTNAQARMLGEIIVALRSPRTQEQLAEGWDISGAWISGLERAKWKNPSIAKLQVLSQALGYPKDALIEFVDGAPLPPPIAGMIPPGAADGHGGSEGWPLFIELKYDALRGEVAELRDELHSLLDILRGTKES